MARRTARELIVEVAFGGFDDGTANWDTNLAIQALLRDFSIEQSIETVDTAGIGEIYSRFRAAGGNKFTLRGTLVVNANTFPITDGNGPMVGHYMRLSVKPDSTLTTPYVWEGIIQRWELRVQRNDLQEVQFEMLGPIDT